MRAGVLTRYREPLEFQDNLPMPAAGPNDVVIRVEACGICRSDWHLWQEDWTWMGISVPLRGTAKLGSRPHTLNFYTSSTYM